MVGGIDLQALRSIRPSAPWLPELALGIARLCVVGLFAIGVSGLVAGAMGALWGQSAVVGDVAGVTYTPERCAELMEYARNADSCEAAAVQHHFEETVDYRVAAGVIGGAGLIALGFARRRGGRTSPRKASVLPASLLPGVGAAVFGVAAAVLALDGVGRLLEGSTHGAGGSLSGAVIAGPVAIVMGLRCLSALSSQPPPTP